MARREKVFGGTQIRDRISLRHWLERHPTLSAIIAVRCAMRVLPIVVGLSPSTVSIQVFRATFVVWTSQRLGWYDKRPLRLSASVADTEDHDAYAYAARAASCAADAASAPAAKAAVDAASAAAFYAVRAASYASVGDSDLWESITADARLVETIASGSALVRQRLWLQDFSRGDRRWLNIPDWARQLFDDFRRSDASQGAEFSIWIRWYEGVLSGRRAGFFDKDLTGQDERDLFVRVAEQENSFWKRRPTEVNENIRHWIDKAKAAKALEILPDPTEGEQDATLLVQRPSSHRFGWRGEKLEAAIVAEPPFDPVLADSIIAELRDKAVEALNALRGNDADEIVARAVGRLSETLQSKVEELAEGVLLMRANTLAAHSRAYSDPKSERDRAIRAILDDLSSSVDSLVDCYPGIRQINANRLALNMQAEDAPGVEAAVEDIAELAKLSGIPSRSANDALNTGRDEVRDLDEKIERETNLARIADYIRARGDLVSTRLLNMANAVSAVLQKAGSEVGGIAGETWREIRKTLPKAAAKGVTRGTESALKTTIEKAPAVLLAYLIAGPWGAVAALVPNLRRHAQKAEEIKKKVEKEIDEA